MVHDGGTSTDRIVFLGHSTVVIQLDGIRLLTDPLLRRGVAHLRRQTEPVDRALASTADAVLISHLHRDHLDIASLRLLGRDTPLLVPGGAAAWLGRRGFDNVRELGVGDRAGVGHLIVTAVHASHDGSRHPGGLRAETVGYVVRGPRAIYFAGDTEVFEQMSELSPELDVALLPVAGWGSRLGKGHMDPLDAARAVSLLNPRLAIPIHWGTLLPVGVPRRRRARLEDPPHLFARHVARIAPNVEVRILAPGEQTAL
jgi:L-ascorbate metabolism protein UlaG (beta-lactamase superfamily)